MWKAIRSCNLGAIILVAAAIVAGGITDVVPPTTSEQIVDFFRNASLLLSACIAWAARVSDAKKHEARHRRKPDTKDAKSDTVSKTDASSSSQSDNEITTSAIAAKPEAPQTFQFDDQSDLAIKKAKATIAAKMGNPASVEFVEIKHAVGTNALGNSSDIICGFVREKNGGPRPFLYFVAKDELYIGGYNIATSPYRHICSITL